MAARATTRCEGHRAVPGASPPGDARVRRPTVRWPAIGCALVVAAPTEATPDNRPAPPAIARGARTFVAFAGRPAPVKLAWTPAANVARYRARWTDADALVDIELPGTATAF